jgi:hypothetical protein
VFKIILNIQKLFDNKQIPNYKKKSNTFDYAQHETIMPGGGLTLRVHAATGSWENEAKFKH